MAGAGSSSKPEFVSEVLHRALCLERARVHWYGKSESRSARKMGHVTFVHDSVTALDKACDEWHSIVASALEAPSSSSGSSSAAAASTASAAPIVMGPTPSNDTTAQATPASSKTTASSEIKALPTQQPSASTASSVSYEAAAKASASASGGSGSASAGPALVGIIMGSDSDLSVMRAAAELCEQFGVRYELQIVSAHRTPLRMVEYAQSAHARGLKVIIAGAGGAAHLPGTCAALASA